jgi:cation:H+ antiporter
VSTALALGALAVGVALVVAGAELFAEHLSDAAARLGVSTFALAVLLAGAEPEELATTLAAAARKVPAVAFGDVIGANLAACLVGVGVAGLVAPLVVGRRVRTAALLALVPGAAAVAAAWSGRVGRVAGGALLGLDVVYLVVVFRLGVAAPAPAATPPDARSRVGRELVLVVMGVALLAVGATMAVEAVRTLSSVESTQTKLSLTALGFATAFELVVLAWSLARRGKGETAFAAIVGSFAFNSTVSLGAAALLRPLVIMDVAVLRLPLFLMPVALLAALALGFSSGRAHRTSAVGLLALYGAFVLAVVLR